MLLCIVNIGRDFILGCSECGCKYLKEDVVGRYVVLSWCDKI